MIVHTQRFRPYFSTKRQRMEEFSLREEVDISKLTIIDGIAYYKDLPVQISLITSPREGMQSLQTITEWKTFKIKPEFLHLFL